MHWDYNCNFVALYMHNVIPNSDTTRNTFILIQFIVRPLRKYATTVQRLPNIVRTSMTFVQRWVDVVRTSIVHWALTVLNVFKLCHNQIHEAALLLYIDDSLVSNCRAYQKCGVLKNAGSEDPDRHL